MATTAPEPPDDSNLVPFDLSPPRSRRPVYASRPGAPVRVADAVEAMLRQNPFGWRDPTIRNCRHYLLGRRFTLACTRLGITSMAALTTDIVEVFLEEQRQAGLAAKTREGYRRYLRSLGRFQAQTPGYGDGLADMGRVVKPKMPRRLPVAPCLDRDQEQALVRVASGRDQLVVELLLATGIRVSELCELEVRDCHLDARKGPTYLLIRGSVWDPDLTKGERDRRVPFRDPYQAVAARLAKHLAGKQPDDHLFTSQRGIDERGRPASLTISGIEQIFGRLSERIGVHAYPHICRHTWATRLADAGMPIFHLQTSGGWESIEMVRRYYRADAAEMFAAFDRIKCT